MNLSLSRNLRNIIMDNLSSCPMNPEMALSGGIDSHSVLIALLELEKKPTAMTFFVNPNSHDLISARETCKIYGLKLREVFIDVSNLVEETRDLIAVWGIWKKTSVECLFPFHCARKDFDSSAMVTGGNADGYFGMSRTASIKGRNDIRELDKIRISLFSDPTYANACYIAKMFGEGSTYIPYFDKRLLPLFMGKSWREVNQPVQKQIIRDAFPELNELTHMNRSRHVNLQLGNSGISESFSKAFASHLAVFGGGNIRKVYGSIYREFYRNKHRLI